MVTHIIDPRWIDVDFPSDKRFTFGFEAPRPEDVARFSASAFEDSFPVMSEAELRESSERLDESRGGIEWLVSRIYNQKSEGSCVANAGGQGHEILQGKQFGLESVSHLSAVSVYDLIGRSAGSGSNISDCRDEGTTTGWIPLDDQVNVARFGADGCHPNTGFRQKKGAKTTEIRKSFRYHETYVVRSAAGLLTAGMLGYPVIVGRGGHSVCYTRGVWNSNKWVVPYPNSWDYDWGQAFGAMTGGFGFDSMSLIKSSSSWAYAVTSIVVPRWYEDLMAKKM